MGIRMRLTTKPAASLTWTGCLPISTEIFFDGLHGLRGGVAACDDLDQLHAVSGVEEVHTHQRAAQAPADLGNGQRGGVGSKDALRLAQLIQLCKGGLLDLHILKGSLHDQIAVCAQVFLRWPGVIAATMASGSPGPNLALSHQLVVASLDLSQALGPLLLDIALGNGVALHLSKCLAMPWPMVPAPITPIFL